MAQPRDELASVPLEQALTELGSSARGLTSAEANSRLQHYGHNEMVEPYRNPALVLLGYFWAPIPWMIEAALALSLAARHWTDAAIIAVLLVMNAVVAFVEEHQAANAIAALKQRLASSARVLRDGVWGIVAVRDLVPGDVVRVRLGDVVPADLRLLDDVVLDVDPSALTGLLAVMGNQAMATLIAVYGALMTPLGWGRAAGVWACALLWFLVNDRVKLATYRWLDRHSAAQH